CWIVPARKFSHLSLGEPTPLGGVSSPVGWRGARCLDRPFIHLARPRRIARLLQREPKVIQALGVVGPPLDIDIEAPQCVMVLPSNYVQRSQLPHNLARVVLLVLSEYGLQVLQRIA